MKIIKEISKDIEHVLDLAEDCAKKAVKYKDDYPNIAQRYWNNTNTYIDMMNGLHSEITTLINTYRKTEGEPPAPMLAVYNYLHERFIDKAAAVKHLQDLYKTM